MSSFDRDEFHQAAYESLFPAIRRLGGTEPPPWADLTEEQRQNIRKANDDYATFMHRLGEAISDGTEPPNPMGN